MTWLAPLGFLGAIGILAILAMYILRQRYIDVRVPSTQLWRMAQAYHMASHPFQKLRKNLLMLLQLLAALLCCLALARPAIMGGLMGRDTVLILDASASMQARDGSPTRFDQAKSDIASYISAMAYGDRAALLVAGESARVAVPLTDSAASLSQALDKLAPECGGADMAGAVSLATAMAREMPGLSIAVFGDERPRELPEGARFVRAGDSSPNRSVLAVTVSETQEGLTALARLMNHGDARPAQIECYADGALFDVREVTLAENAETPVYFRGLPEGVARVEVRYADSDALTLDDAGYCAVPVGTGARVLLVTKGNLYLETALSLRTDIELNKVSPEEAPGLSGFSLYIYDGSVPEPLPEDGHVLLLGGMGTVAPGGTLTRAPGAENSPLLAHVSELGVAMLRHGSLDQTYTPLWRSGEDTVLGVRQQGNQRVAALALSLPETNLPLRKDFPILVQNLLDYMIPRAVDARDAAVCGESVTVTAHAFATELALTTPSGRQIPLAPPFPVRPLRDATEPGFYELTQTFLSGGEEQREQWLFAAQIPRAESELRAVSGDAPENEQRREAMPLELSRALMLAALAALLIEWGVFCRGR